MSFKEAVIIPYSMFKKCNFDRTPKQDHEIILENPNLPADVKMKLFNQAKILAGQKSEEQPVEDSSRDKNEESYIVQLFPDKDQPFIASILEKLKANTDEISWDDNMRVNIDGKLHRDSNIIELLRFTMKNLIITADTDIPAGAREFLEKLIAIGVPKSWIRVNFRRQPPKRLLKRRHLPDTDFPPAKTQKGQGWIRY